MGHFTVAEMEHMESDIETMHEFLESDMVKSELNQNSKPSRKLKSRSKFKHFFDRI